MDITFVDDLGREQNQSMTPVHIRVNQAKGTYIFHAVDPKTNQLIQFDCVKIKEWRPQTPGTVVPIVVE